ncbi:MAG: uracil-DNA glycosylase [Halodesulfurarchaeum sp.]
MDESSLTVRRCTRCQELTDSRNRIVDGTGPSDADLLFVGEAPGEQEDREGEPFVGRSGDLLEEALADHDLPRAAVRITNVVRCRPPENRNPTVAERANCRSYLDREIAVVDPEAVVALGKIPSEELLDRPVAVTEEAGRVETVEIEGTAYRVLIGLHPAATMYDPGTREPFEAAIERAAAIVAGEQ